MNLRRLLVVLAVTVVAFYALQLFLSGSKAQSGGAPQPIFYDLDVVAVNGQNGLTGLFAAPSINDKGVVAMSGRTTGGAIFVSDAVGTSHNILPSFASPTRFFAGGVQIDNNNQVLSQELISSTSPLQSFLRRSDGNAINTSTVLYGANGVGLNDFDSIYPNPSMNNAGQVSFSALIGSSTTNLITGVVRPAFARAQLANSGSSLRPMIADDGRVAVQVGVSATDPIVLYANNLATSTGIASSANGFSAMGQSPGISDNGKIVVFYGNLTTGPTPGPGIFASVDEGSGTRGVVRLTGRAAELGNDAAGSPLAFSASGYSTSMRVGVIHQELAASGLDGDSFIVCFMATPTGASPDGLFTVNSGLWTVRTDVTVRNGTTTYRTFGPTPVAQVGDNVGSFTLSAISVYDPIAKVGTETINGAVRTERRGENRVTFQATTTSANIVVRGTYLDTDEDSLPDRWETGGVTIAGVFIDLPGMGASATHKDLFVHADWMESSGGATFKPKSGALKKVAAVFRSAPVSNPDGATGINIHIDAGSDSIMNPATNQKWKTFSRAGSVPFQSSILPLVGSAYQWSDVDTIKATHFTNNRRGPIFHYALFANQFNSGNRSGLSRGIPAADFVVTLGLVMGGTEQQQAGTFIHELGHNLGLRHGGDESVPERKPNYLSLMNYSFQMGGLIKANKKRELNYSTRTLPSLDELSLNEAIGITDPDNHRTIWASPLPTPPAVPSPCPHNLTAPAVDWNCDGSLTAGTLAAEINGDTTTSTGTTPLHGFADWPAVTLDGGGKTGTAVARGDSIDSESSPTEPSISELLVAPPDILQEQLCDIEENVVVTPEAGGAAPLEVTFDASGAVAPCGSIASYEWDFGDGTTSGSGQVGVFSGPTRGLSNSEPIVTHIYDTPGTYIATVNITDSEGYTNLTPLEYVVLVTSSSPPQADLAISMTALPNPVPMSSPLTYTLSVTNHGPDTALGVVVSDELPANVSFVSATTTQGSCDGATTVNCSLGTLANATTATVTIVVTAGSSGTVTNTATVESNLLDSNLGNNAATTNTTVAAPGANSPILFTSNRDGNTEIYVMQSDGSGQTRLTNNAASDTDPCWSPDRTRIAFVSRRTGFDEIFLMNANGTNQVQLTAFGDFISDVAWSPNGTNLAFAKGGDIFVMSVDANELTNVTNNYGDRGYYGDPGVSYYGYAGDSSPSFSPDGDSITFAGQEDDSRFIYVMDIYEQIRQTIESGDGVSSPAWSVSNKIAFVSYGNLCVMDPNGANHSCLTIGGLPSWSADGAKIAFITNRDGNVEIYKMDANGSNQTRLTNNSAADSRPRW